MRLALIVNAVVLATTILAAVFAYLLNKLNRS
jgi:hypothetical protein